MGKTEVVSRLAGLIFGLAVTFGVTQETSAPSQIDTDELEEISAILG